MTMTKQDRICMISLFAVMLVLMGVPALCLSTNTVVDELGTLTNTALLTGRNWGTGIISNGGFYYRYGMAFVWLLPFLIFKDPIMVYKAASFVNALFMATTPVMAYYISRRYLKIEKEKEHIGKVAVCTAGTADISVAEEAAQTAEYFGTHVDRIYDVGVSGMHRLFSRLDTIQEANCVVAVAGMEGALASVMGGLVKRPVIAVPTSVGYGASFHGLSALLTMINSCANGIAVVNIDNGYGAGYLATQINRLAEGK